MLDTNSYDLYENAYREIQRDYPDLCFQYEQAWRTIIEQEADSRLSLDLCAIKNTYRYPSTYLALFSLQGKAIHPVLSLPIMMGMLPLDSELSTLMFRGSKEDESDSLEDEFSGLSGPDILGKLFDEFCQERWLIDPDSKELYLAALFIEFCPEESRPTQKPETLVRYRNAFLHRSDKTLD